MKSKLKQATEIAWHKQSPWSKIWSLSNVLSQSISKVAALEDGGNSEFSGACWRPRTGHFTS